MKDRTQRLPKPEYLGIIQQGQLVAQAISRRSIKYGLIYPEIPNWVEMVYLFGQLYMRSFR